MKAFIQKLANAGFEKLSLRKIKNEIRRQNYNIGVDLNSFTVMKRKEGSNFFVFLGVEERLRKPRLIAVFYNPASPLEKDISREKIIIKEVVDKSTEASVMNRIVEAMKEKPSETYFFWPHNHAGFVKFKGKYYRLIDLKPGEIPFVNGPVDDGVNKPFEIMLYAAFYHGDFYAITSHNHFYMPLYEELKKFGDELSIVVVPGTEFTMPPFGFDAFDVALLMKALEKKGIKINLKRNEFGGYNFEDVNYVLESFKDELKDVDLPMRTINGPHVVVLYASPEIGKEVQNEILNDRDVLYAPISSRGVELVPTLKKLKRKYGKDVFVILAHPFCDLKLPSVGIGNRIEFGELPWDVLSYLKKHGLVDAIAAYNPGVSNEIHPFERGVDKESLRGLPAYLKKLVDYWNKKRVKRAKKARRTMEELTRQKWGMPTRRANEMNMALARFANHEFYWILVGEPDTHYYGHFDLRELRMNHLGRVVTVINNLKERNLKGLFDALHRAKLSRKAVDYIAYVQFKDGKLQISDERKPSFREKIEKQWIYFESYGLHGFLRILLKDVIGRIKRKVRRSGEKIVYIIRKFVKR